MQAGRRRPLPRSGDLLLLLALTGACGGRVLTASPCTSCPNVSGEYSESLSRVLATEATCGELLSIGGEDSLQISQPDGGSLLRIQSNVSGAALLEATLNDDSTVTMVTPATAQIAGGRTAQLSLNGRFFLGSPRRFEGSYDVTLPDRICVGSDNAKRQEHLEVSTVWTERQ